MLRLALILVSLASLANEVSSTCNIQTSTHVVFVKNFHSKSVAFRTSQLRLGENESLLGFCANKVKATKQSPNQAVSYGTNVTISCLNGVVQLGDSSIAPTGQWTSLTCMEAKRDLLYESVVAMPGCEKFWSLGYGIELNENIVKAGICYDLPNRQLKSVNYVSSTTSEMDIIDTEPLITTVELSHEISDLEQYSPAGSKYIPKKLLLDQEFEFRSIVLDDFQMKLSPYEKIFQIPFWKKLYTGNWKLFLDAFKEHTQSIDFKYNIFSGVSKFLEVPQQNSHLKKVYKDIPRLIWTYLRPIRNDTTHEDLVIIADNSPYFESGITRQLCPSKCRRISWLQSQPFGNLHQLPINGLMYCCNPQNVSSLLDFFPVQREPSIEIKTLN